MHQEKAVGFAHLYGERVAGDKTGVELVESPLEDLIHQTACWAITEQHSNLDSENGKVQQQVKVQRLDPPPKFKGRSPKGTAIIKYQLFMSEMHTLRFYSC